MADPIPLNPLKTDPLKPVNRLEIAPLTDGIVRLWITGEIQLTQQPKYPDSYLTVCLNDREEGHTSSFSGTGRSKNGSAIGGIDHWSTGNPAAIYIGRNGGGSDVEFSAEIMIFVQREGRKILTRSSAVYAMANRDIINWQGAGVLIDNGPLTSIQVEVMGHVTVQGRIACSPAGI